MELVKLKMKKSYKTFLSLIGLLIIFIISIGCLYLINPRSLINSIIEVNGDLSINFIDGKSIKTKDNKKIRFSITNNSDHVNYYVISFTKVRGNATYKLISNNSVMISDYLKSVDSINSEYLSIDAKDTKSYILEISSEEGIKGTFKIQNIEEQNEYFSDMILKQTPPVNSAKTKVGVDVALDDEGLIKSNDDIGVSYYYRGSVKNNYVLFGGLLWRIVRINGNGTVRMILDGETSTIGSYYTSNNKNFEFDKSNMKKILDDWLDENLKDYNDLIATSKFCSDIEYDNDLSSYANERIFTNQIPVLACLGKTINNKVGLLSIDEVILAGANTKTINQNFYLYNKKITSEWYTLSSAKGDEATINMFMINVDGSININRTGNLNRSIRPVISLEKNIQMTGDGTIDNPYRLLEN